MANVKIVVVLFSLKYDEKINIFYFALNSKRSSLFRQVIV